MNNVVYDQLTGMPIDPMAKQQVPNPGTAVYNNPMAMNAAAGVYGNPFARQQSVMMVDQNGDGKITQGDVIEAKINGYKE